MNAAGGQIQGMRRRQEDAWAVDALAGGGLLAMVADGLGGHPAGDVASREAVREMAQVFRELLDEPDADPRECLKRSVLAADARLRILVTEQPDLQGMATTLVALYVRGSEFWAATVGDSYLLLRRRDQLVGLNELHTEGGGVTSCVGFHLSRVDLADRLLVEAGDRFLLATDGIATLDSEEISVILGEAADPDTAVQAMLRTVEEAGVATQDNVTLVAVFA